MTIEQYQIIPNVEEGKKFITYDLNGDKDQGRLFLWLPESDGRRAILATQFVAPNKRGNGIGREMQAMMFEDLRSRNVAEVTASIRECYLFDGTNLQRTYEPDPTHVYGGFRSAQSLLTPRLYDGTVLQSALDFVSMERMQNGLVKVGMGLVIYTGIEADIDVLKNVDLHVLDIVASNISKLDSQPNQRMEIDLEARV